MLSDLAVHFNYRNLGWIKQTFIQLRGSLSIRIYHVDQATFFL